MDCSLVFGDVEGDRLVYGPLAVGVDGRAADGEALHVSASIELWIDGRIAQRDDADVEALALGNLRADLRTLRTAGRGAVVFNTHDHPEVASLLVRSDGLIDAVANLWSADVWNLPLSPMPFRGLEAVIVSIDRFEAEVGPLTGYCVHGAPQPTYVDCPLLMVGSA